MCEGGRKNSILILDEPTSGLDPLMQNRFIELIEEEKKKGKTILLSSHIVWFYFSDISYDVLYSKG